MCIRDRDSERDVGPAECVAAGSAKLRGSLPVLARAALPALHVPRVPVAGLGRGAVRPAEGVRGDDQRAGRPRGALRRGRGHAAGGGRGQAREDPL
eukprot:5880732-Alexandrium_andersonii.AAC.1